MVQGKRPKKILMGSNTYTDPIENSEEQKRRVIFHRRVGTPAQPYNIAQDILHAVNKKLLSLKVPAHLRLVKLRNDYHRNLTGLTTTQTAADSMFLRFKEVILQIALRFDAEITEIAANQ